MNKALFAVTACLALVLSTGCRTKYKASEPIHAIPQACCAEGDSELQHFKGCRPTGRCKTGEPFWLRGAIMCGPVDEAACNGRCCEYRPPSDFGKKAEEEPTPEPVNTSSEESLQSDPVETEPAPESAPQTEPAPDSVAPSESQPEPEPATTPTPA